MGPHRGPPKGWSPSGDKNFGDPKRSIVEGVFEIKKKFLRGRYKTERDSIWEPIGDHLKDGHLRGIKNFRDPKRSILESVEIKKLFLRGKDIRPKETQFGTP